MWRIILPTNYLGFKMRLLQIITQTLLTLSTLLLCSHFFSTYCYFTARLLSNLNDSFPCVCLFSRFSCRNCSQTCLMTCWTTVETPPPQSWSTPPAAIKTLAAGNKNMETNCSSTLLSHKGQDHTLGLIPTSDLVRNTYWRYTVINSASHLIFK